jgi:hypothetical protein
MALIFERFVFKFYIFFLFFFVVANHKLNVKSDIQISLALLVLVLWTKTTNYQRATENYDAQHSRCGFNVDCLHVLAEVVD